MPYIKITRNCLLPEMIDVDFILYIFVQAQTQAPLKSTKQPKPQATTEVKATAATADLKPPAATADLKPPAATVSPSSGTPTLLTVALGIAAAAAWFLTK
jgi:hypothetical protein